MVRLDRIELTTATDRVELRFHREVTLVTGLGRLEREALRTEILGALGAGRPGLSLDVIADDGRYLAVHRPLEGPPSVFDAVAGVDVTERFLQDDESETIDLMGLLGLTRTEAKSLLTLGVDDLVSHADVNDTVARLGALDQDALWSCAIRVAELEVEMATLVDDELPADRLCAEVADAIEDAHATRDIARDRLEQARTYSLLGSGCLALIAFFVALITHPFLAVPFIAGSIAGGVWSWRRHREYEEAAAAEQAVLERAGMGSYLNFQLKKVDELTGNADVRSRSLELAEQHRHARQTWHEMVGANVSLEWAAANRPAIAEAARFMADHDGELPGTLDPTETFAAAFVNIRRAIGEAAPLLVDDVFSDMDDAEVFEALTAIETYAPHLQIVVTTSDARVVEWAGRMAAQGRSLSIPLGTAEASPSEADTASGTESVPSIVRSPEPATTAVDERISLSA